MGAIEACPSRRTLALSIIGAAVGPIVTVTGVNTVGPPLTRWTGLRAVAANPPRVALTRAVAGATGAVVSAGAAPRTVLPKPATGAHIFAQDPFEPWEAVTLARDVMTWPVVMDTRGTRLAAAVAEVTRGTDTQTGGPSVTWGTFTGALVRGAGGPVLAVTG